MSKDEKKISVRNLNKSIDLIRNGMDRIYRNTYFSTQRNNNSLNQIKSSIDDSIDKLIDNNIKNTGNSSITSLYNRLDNKRDQLHSKALSELEELFNDNFLTDMIMNTWSSNRYIKEHDNDIDILCKYMPQLEEALNVKKDNVLAADYFNKDFIHATAEKKPNDVQIITNIKKIKEEYDLLEKFENYEYNTSKYGEELVYIVPYKKALNKLLSSDSRFNNLSESANLEDGQLYSILYESTNDHILFDGKFKKEDIPDIRIEINRSNVLPSAVQEIRNIIRLKESSLLESTSMFDNTIPDDTKLKGLYDDEVSRDGLIQNNKNIIKDIPGCIVKTLSRENVKPIYIDDMCMGYYYMEWLGKGDPFADNQVNNYDPMFMSKTMGNGSTINRELDNSQFDEDYALKKIAEKISSSIDKNFINNNQDLRKEIYMMLKYNESVAAGQKTTFRITYIPPEDIEHIYFKMNPKTHRGISDLENSILPATLYTGLYMTNTMGILTRGFDKRVYYVKQSIDSNISKSLLNAINQIKKSNFGSREMTSIKHILNITGRYDDYIIPTNSSGESPINFEVMPGQNIDLKTPLMEEYERMAVNSTGVPFEMVQIRENSVDYAVQLSMVNSKFIRYIFKAQSKLNASFSRILTKIYNYEFDVSEIITVKLPPPTYLNLMQTSSMLDNNDTYATKITEIMLPNEEDELKLIFKKNLARELLATFIDYDLIDRIHKESKMEYEKIEAASSDNEGGGQE